MWLTHRWGEDHLPGVLHALLAGLGFEEPSWTGVFVLVVAIGFIVAAVCAVRALMDHW